MTVYRLSRDLLFPSAEEADPSGLLAVGGDLSPERLMLAYSMGIFPWYGDDQPILWHAPDPRLVLLPGGLRVSRSLRRTIDRGGYEIRFDTAFGEVIRACARVLRPQGDGTWITEDMVHAYEQLFELGFAHSAEAWQDGELAGGLYGVALGGCFFGESMFSLRSDASKVAFTTLVRQLERWRFDLIDCQIHSEHLARFGAVEWSRERFMNVLASSIERPTRRGRWTLDDVEDTENRDNE